MLVILWNDICMKWKQVLANAIGIAIMMFLGVMLTTAYFEQSRQYEPFRSMFRSEGVILSYMSEDAAKVWANQMKSVDGFYNLSFSSYVYIDGVEDYSFKVYGYDPLIASYKSTLQEGIWYSDYRGEYIPVIVTDSYGLKAGDVVDIFFDKKTWVTAYVCGILANGAALYTDNYYSSEADIYSFYTAIDTDRDEQTAFMLMDKETMASVFPNYSTMGRFFVKYSDGITESETAENTEYLREQETIIYNSFSEIKERTLKIINQRLMVIIPVIISAFLLISLAIATTVSIDVFRSMRTYAIFFCNGITWYRCMLLSMGKAVMSCILGTILMFTGYNIVTISGYGQKILFSLGKTQILMCIIIVIAVIVLSAIIPLFILYKNQPVKVLKESYI